MIDLVHSLLHKNVSKLYFMNICNVSEENLQGTYKETAIVIPCSSANILQCKQCIIYQHDLEIYVWHTVTLYKMYHRSMFLQHLLQMNFF